MSLNEINYVWRPGENLNFGDGVGVENPHIVFNPEKMTITVTGSWADLTQYYEIWGNFPEGGANWSATKMTLDDDPTSGIRKAENVVVENKSEFVLRFMVSDVVKHWLHPYESTEITTPGTYPCIPIEYDYNYSIVPGKWDITYNRTLGTLTVESAIGAVDEIEADSQSVATIYYNLQGVRVDNPTAGDLYIVVRGNKTTKEYVK